MTLVQTYHYNFLTPLILLIGLVECDTWKQLVWQGEHAERILVRIQAEGQSLHVSKVEALVIETTRTRS